MATDRQTFEFTALMAVFDPAQLLAAAIAHPDAIDGKMSKMDFVDSDGSVNIAECLKMLLDPGSLPGCNFIESTAEQL
jgi:hypothetical protein